MSNQIDPIRLSKVRMLVQSGKAREIREAALLSRHEIASSLGVSDQSVVSWELQGNNPRPEVAMRYLNLLESLQRMQS